MVGCALTILRAEATYFRNAVAIDGGKVAMIVRDGRVEAIGPKVKAPRGATSVDLGGKFIMPGLISTHVHISDAQGLRTPAYTAENVVRQLGVFARYGVTSVWSLGGEKAPAFAIRDGHSTAYARLYLSGEVIVGKTPEQAREMVRKVAAAGNPDLIKIRVDDNLGTSAKMSPEVYRAVIGEAHKLGRKVAVHIYYLDDAKDLLRAGTDFIAHSVRDREIDEEFIQLMKSRNIPYCPTLTRELSTFVYESTPDFFADPFFLQEADPAVVAQLNEPARQEAMRNSRLAQGYKKALPMAQRNLKKAVDAGLLVVMGTDAGPTPSRFQGYFEHLEMRMMVESGLTPAQVLQSATGDAARAMGMPEAGALAPGKWADFVVLTKNPLADIGNTRTIQSVWIGGKQIPPAVNDGGSKRSPQSGRP